MQKIQILFPTTVRFAERGAYALMLSRGAREDDAVRALEQKRGDRTVERDDMRAPVKAFV